MGTPRTAFVLAGGGSLGAVEVGMLQALVERGIAPDLVVGASVGAINGAYFAGRLDRAGVEGLAAIWRDLRRGDVAAPGGNIVEGTLVKVIPQAVAAQGK